MGSNTIEDKLVRQRNNGYAEDNSIYECVYTSSGRIITCEPGERGTHILIKREVFEAIQEGLARLEGLED